MRITGARIYLVRIAGRHPVLVELLTDDGVTGVGDAALAYGTGATAGAGMVKDLVDEIVLGKDPFRIEALWGEMYDGTFWAKGGGPIVFAAISAIEMALWDLKGKALRLPVYEMLGGRTRSEVRVYANGWSFRAVTPDDFARAAERVVKDGYDALKMYPLARPLASSPHGNIQHVEGRRVERDFERLAVAKVRAVRDAIGPDVDLMVDMSAELTTDAAIRIGQQLEDLDLLFFEEPVDPFDVDALRKVADKVDLTIAVGERLYTRYGFRRVLELHAADVLQPDIGNTGGILETLRIAAAAETYDMLIQPHLCASPVATAAALQVDACVRNLLIQELYPYRVPEHFAIVDRAPELDVRNGRLEIPDRPGLGVNLVPERVRPHLWAECG